MGKKLVLGIIILLALGCLGGFIFLGDKIAEGKQKIADGQKQLAEGQKMLAEGKARLANGERRLSSAKHVYKGINSIPLMGIVDKLPISGQIFKQASDKISAGNELVEKGSQKIKAGESQLAEGKTELQRGEERLSHTNNIRNSCGVGALLFGSLAIVLGYLWRKKW